MKSRRPFRWVSVAMLSFMTPALVHGCGIDLTDDLSGKPCKNGACLDGWTCRNDVCVPNDELPGGGSGSGGGAMSIDAGGTASGGASGGHGGTVGGGGAGDSDSGLGGGGFQDAGVDAATGGAGGLVVIDAAIDVEVPTDAPVEAAPPGRAGRVECAGSVCDIAAASCCIGTFLGYPDPPAAEEFSCVSDTSGCDWILECDGDHDCVGSEVCCASVLLSGATRTQCTSFCGIGNPRIECTSGDDCGAGLVCCGHLQYEFLGGDPSRYDQLRCSDTCAGTDDRIVCADTSDCVNGGTCAPSSVFPGISTCQ